MRLKYTPIVALVLLASCTKNDFFEKNLPIPGREWNYSFRPSIEFEITDTVPAYNIYVVLRHTNAYAYNNIWLDINYILPGDTARREQVEVQLASNERGWLGVGMDDIFEIRKLITPQPYRFRHAGRAIFTLQQIMRENPLSGVMNAGIRVEKALQR